MNTPDYQLRRISPQYSITLSPEVASYVEAVLVDYPAEFRSRSAIVDFCIRQCMPEPEKADTEQT